MARPPMEARVLRDAIVHGDLAGIGERLGMARATARAWLRGTALLLWRIDPGGLQASGALVAAPPAAVVGEASLLCGQPAARSCFTQARCSGMVTG